MKSNPQDQKNNPNKNTPNIQGEGDYDAARRYDQSARDFAQSGKVGPAAEKAAPHNKQEADELQRAEDTGKSHAKGEDPGVAR